MDDTTADSTTVERESSLLARENAKLRQNCADLEAQLAALQRELKNGVGASEFAAFREAATASERRAENATRDAQASGVSPGAWSVASAASSAGSSSSRVQADHVASDAAAPSSTFPR